MQEFPPQVQSEPSKKRPEPIPNPDKQEKKLSPNQKIEALGLEIKKLQDKRDQTLKQIDDLTKSWKKMPKKERENHQGISFIEFEKDEESRQVKAFLQKKKMVLEYEGTSEQSQNVAQSDILTDMRWGIFYDLNQSIVSKDLFSKYNRLRKEYVTAYFQYKINQLIDQQMLIQRLEIDNVEMEDELLAKAYKKSQDPEREKRLDLFLKRSLVVF